MHPDLERILAEDEAARAAVDSAASAARRRVDAAREEIDRARGARAEALRAEADRAVSAIETEGRRTVAERGARRKAFLEQRLASADAAFERAVDLYLRIVRGLPPGTST